MTKNKKEKFPGYPLYPESEDLYSQSKEEADIDPEHPDQLKKPVENTGKLNEKNFEQDVSAGDLDIPGSELDDEQESTGNEDEENNFYSLGGDNHD